MTSLILRTATHFMLPLLLLFSVFLLVRGHNEPGGGFSGGLVASAAFVLYALAFGVPTARFAMRANPRLLIGAGLLVALGSGVLGLFRGQAFMSHRDFWTAVSVPGVGRVELGTPLLFDLGVYLVVVGVTMTIMLRLAEQ